MKRRAGTVVQNGSSNGFSYNGKRPKLASYKEWRREHLEQFLLDNHMENVAHIFSREKIKSQALPLLNEDRLKEIGIRNLGERLEVLQLFQPILNPDSGHKDVPDVQVCSVRKYFRFKPGMKSILLDQVLKDNPEGSGHSAKGWDVTVNRLRQRGGDWERFTVRLARETTRSMVAENKNEDENDEETVLNKIAKLWKNNIKTVNSCKKLQRKKLSEAVRKTASERAVASTSADLGMNEDMETTDQELTPPQRTDILEFLKESREKELRQQEDELDLKKKSLELEERKLLLQEDQAKLNRRQTEAHLQILERNQEIQFQQFQALLDLLKNEKSK